MNVSYYIIEYWNTWWIWVKQTRSTTNQKYNKPEVEQTANITCQCNILEPFTKMLDSTMCYIQR